MASQCARINHCCILNLKLSILMVGTKRHYHPSKEIVLAGIGFSDLIQEMNHDLGFDQVVLKLLSGVGGVGGLV